MTDNKKKTAPPPLFDRHTRRWLGYGVELGGVVGLFTWAGYCADDFFGVSPWLTVSGALFSLTGMIYLLFKEVLASGVFKNRDKFSGPDHTD